MRSPTPKEKRIEMQYRYDEMRKAEGEPVRVVTYLQNETYEKLKRIADEKNKSIDEIIDSIL